MTLRPATGPIPKPLKQPKEKKRAGLSRKGRLAPVSKKKQAKRRESAEQRRTRQIAAAVMEYPPVVREVSTAAREVAAPIEKAMRLRSRRWLDLVKDYETCRVRGCFALAVDPHHVRVRGRRDDTFDFTAIPLCRKHHDAAHDGLIPRDELHRMLGEFLCLFLPLVTRSEMREVLEEMLAGLEEG